MPAIKVSPPSRLLGYVLIGLSVALQSACVTGRRTMELPVASTSAAPVVTRGHVYISSVTDDRVFANKPADPSTPSIAGDVTQLSAAEKDRMIGRQRNTFGHAMGDVGLPPGDSMTKRMRVLVEQALARDGYQVSADEHAPNSIAVSVNEFWSWMTPGFWALEFEAKLMCTVSVDNGDGHPHVAIVRGYGLNHGQFAKNANLQEAFQPAFDDFVANFATEINKIGLRDDQQPLSVADGRSIESADIFEQLKKLDQLKKEGIITDQEFDSQKKKILDQHQ